MIVRGDIGDLYGVWGSLKRGVGKVGSAVYHAPGTALSAARSGASSIGRVALAPITVPLDLSYRAARGLTSGVANIGGKILGAPIGLLRSAGSGVGAGFMSTAAPGGGSGSDATNAATTAAAQNAVAMQQATPQMSPGGGYSTSPSGGGADLSPYQSAQTSTGTPADQAAAAAAASEGIMDKFAALSTPAKVAVVGGIGGIGWLLYKRLGGRRSKS